MITLNSFQPGKAGVKTRKRIGRGTGSGQGSTAGKGNNGARSRSGQINKLYFEGGQCPLMRRTPKKGFNNKNFRVEYQIVNLGDLEQISQFPEAGIDVSWLYENGYIHNAVKPVKVLGNGDFSKKLVIQANAFSKTALQKIEKAQGKADVIRNA